MEIQPNQQAQDNSRSARPGKFDPTLRVREDLERRVTESRQDRDQIDVSDRARTLAAGPADSDGPAQAARVQALRAQVQSGQFNSAERAEKSAGQMLSN